MRECIAAYRDSFEGHRTQNIVYVAGKMLMMCVPMALSIQSNTLLLA